MIGCFAIKNFLWVWLTSTFAHTTNKLIVGVVKQQMCRIYSVIPYGFICGVVCSGRDRIYVCWVAGWLCACLCILPTCMCLYMYVQVFLVKCVVAMPCLVLSPGQVDFGMCLVGHTYSANVEVINTSSSDTAWTASVSTGVCL